MHQESFGSYKKNNNKILAWHETGKHIHASKPLTGPPGTCWKGSWATSGMCRINRFRLWREMERGDTSPSWGLSEQFDGRTIYHSAWATTWQSHHNISEESLPCQLNHAPTSTLYCCKGSTGTRLANSRSPNWMIRIFFSIKNNNAES